jgi:hypothetical protein
MNAATANTPLISPRLAIALVLISALTALGFLALSAYAPDLRSDRSGGATVISKSAIGFAGLRVLLENLHVGVNVGREPPASGQFSLVILTPGAGTDDKDIEKLAGAGPRLIVLPKWTVSGDREHDGWVKKLDVETPGTVGAILQTLAKGAKLAQHKGVYRTGLKAEYDQFDADAQARAVSIDRVQTISGPNLEPDITDDEGKAVLVQVKGTQTYILSEPDILNNQGLHDIAVARLAYTIIQTLRRRDNAVSFDVTLNGFRRSPDLLRTVFSPPFLGATLCALLAAAFLGFHAMSRFGSPRAPDRVFAFGKRALADNTAAIIRMMKREPAMAARYSQAVLSQIAAFFGISREKAADPSVVRALEQRGTLPYRFADLEAEARDARDAQGLMQVARKLYRWRRTITHGHL